MKTKTRKTTRILCASSIAAMTLLGSVAPALTTVAAEGEIKLPVAENTITFDKKIYLDANENVPNATINYKLEGRDASGDENDPTSEKGALAALGYRNVENGTATLSDLPTDLSTKFTTDDDKDVKEDGNGQRSITKTCTIDAGDLAKKATKPTVYTYTLSESTTDGFITAKEGDTRKLNIYVGYNESNKLAVLYSTLAKTDGTKVTGFENNYLTSDNEATKAFKVTKKVTGNQGDKTASFGFTVTIKKQYSKVTVYYPDGTKAESSAPNDSNVVTVNTKLKDGQSLTVKGLTQGAEYGVDEDKEDKGQNGYTTTKADPDPNTGEIAETVVTNDRTGTIPTGIYLNHKLPFNILGVALAGGAVALIAKKRHEDALEDEDDE